MNKLLLILVLIFCAAFVLAGCSSDGTSPTSSGAMPSSFESSSKPTPTNAVQTSTQTSPPLDTSSPSPTPETIPVLLQSKIKMTSEQRSGKVAYITIDDGPSENTPALLQMLNEKGVKATFFLIGKNAEKYPQYVKDIAAAGDAIGNHSYSHNYSLIYQSPDTLRDEIVHTNNIIKSILGQDYNVSIFRFPGGLKQNEKAYAQVVWDLGMDYYAWSIDPEDAVGQNSSVAELVEKFKEQLGKQQHPVIIMHDANNKTTSVQALGEMIDILKSKGYSFDVIAKP